MELHEHEFPPAKGAANFYFLDQFSLNQHTFVDDNPNPKQTVEEDNTNPHAERPDETEAPDMQQKIVDALRAQMLKSGHVLMCLWPLEAPTPLRRAWCLFELWVALQNDIKLTMCFGKAEAKDLLAAVCAGSFDANKMVGEIRAQDAGSMLQQDKDLILGLIEREMGVEQFNTEMQAKLRKCIKDTVTSVIARAASVN